MSSDIQKLQRAGRRWWVRQERARWLYATLGRVNSDGTVTVAAPRQSYVWITMDTGTLTQAYNKGNGAVPLRPGLPVKVRDDAGRLIIDGENTSGLLEGDSNAPGSVYSVNSVPPDSHGNVILDTDDIDEGATNLYYTAERVRDDIATALVAGTNITITPNDGADTITIASTVTAYTDEQAQDAVAAAAIDTATIDFTYTDATPEFKWDVKNSSITYAKIQNVSATDKLLGRSTAGAGVVEEITLTATGRSIIAAASVAAAQTALALTPGTNVQAFDATLLSIAALGTAADRMLYTTGVDTWAELTTTSYGRSLLAAAAAVNARATLGLVIGTDVQAQDAELAAIAGLTSAADTVPYFTGLGTAALATFTSFGRTLAALADAAAGRTALALGTIATMAESLFVLLGGRAGGQTISGGTAAGENLTLRSTSHATPGKIVLGAAGTSAYDAVNDRLGIGANDPAAQLEVTASTTAATRGFITGQHNNSAAAALFYFQKSRGTRASPNTVNNGDFPGVFYWQVHDGTNYLATAAIAAKANGTVATGSIPTDLIISVGATDDLGLTNERLRIKSTGEVGIGIAAPNATVLGIKAGASTNDAAVGGVLSESHSATGNVGTGEDDLLTYVVPANTLSVNGMSLRFEASGTCAANINLKHLRVRFGTSGTSLFADFTVTTSGGGSNWVLRGRIIRTGAATQKGYASVVGSNITNTSDLATTLNQTLSGAVTLRITGEATSNNDIACESLIVNWDDFNT